MKISTIVILVNRTKGHARRTAEALKAVLDRERIRQRVIRVLDPNCHAESPRSRTRRMINNVRIVGMDGDLVTVAANFVCYRYRRYERIREYVGAYRYVLKCAGGSFRIKERRVLIDAHELGSLGSVSFIL